MNDKILNSLAILILIIIISVMSWRDMHPQVEAEGVQTLSTVGYYTGAGITADMIPDDNRPITVGVGEFSYAPDGKLQWTAQGMTPTNIPQRQINLQFTFKNLPQNPDETIAKLNAFTDGWLHSGDTINVVVLDYNPAKPDLKSYLALLKAAHENFRHRYLVYAGINILWTHAMLKELQAFAPQFVVHVPERHIDPALLTKLWALKYNLTIQYPAGTQPADLDVPAIKKFSSLNAITLTLDPHAAPPKKEEKVGLFPKL